MSDSTERREHGNVHEIVKRRWAGQVSEIRSVGADAAGLLATDDRAAAAFGRQSFLPHTRHVTRYIRADRGASRREIKAVRDMAYADTPREKVYAYGPLRSTVQTYPEPMDNLHRGPMHGMWWPISEAMHEDGTYSPGVGIEGGKWIGPYQGVAPAKYWFDLHCRVSDRMTFAPLRVSAYVNDQELMASERFSLQARHNAAESLVPNGDRCVTDPAHEGHPMVKWQSACGNGGYDGAHLIRGVRAALALCAYWPGDCSWLVQDELRGVANHVSWWLSPFKAVEDAWGPGENKSYMVNEAFPYRAKGPQTILRAPGWGCFVAAPHLGRRWTFSALKFWEDCVMPSGFMQVMPWDMGSPAPKQYGALENEHSSAGIEAPIGLAGAVATALAIDEGLPQSLEDAIEKQARMLLELWGPGEPEWPKYWIVRRDGQDLAKAEPKGKGDNHNEWLTLELALRFTALADKIERRKEQILDLWEKYPTWRPWMAGLVGQLA